MSAPGLLFRLVQRHVVLDARKAGAREQAGRVPQHDTAEFALAREPERRCLGRVNERRALFHGKQMNLLGPLAPGPGPPVASVGSMDPHRCCTVCRAEKAPYCCCSEDVGYCSAKCQRLDWVYGGHFFVCGLRLEGKRGRDATDNGDESAQKRARADSDDDASDAGDGERERAQAYARRRVQGDPQYAAWEVTDKFPHADVWGTLCRRDILTPGAVALAESEYLTYPRPDDRRLQQRVALLKSTGAGQGAAPGLLTWHFYATTCRIVSDAMVAVLAKTPLNCAVLVRGSTRGLYYRQWAEGSPVLDTMTQEETRVQSAPALVVGDTAALLGRFERGAGGQLILQPAGPAQHWKHHGRDPIAVTSDNLYDMIMVIAPNAQLVFVGDPLTPPDLDVVEPQAWRVGLGTLGLLAYVRLPEAPEAVQEAPDASGEEEEEDDVSDASGEEEEETASSGVYSSGDE